MAALAATTLYAQADPDWLSQWRLAQTHRPAQLTSSGHITKDDEPGTALIVDGRVFQPDGATPAAEVVVFAYQTDAEGLYRAPAKAGAPWRLRGWARTDAAGHFEFRTIRPAPYPGRRVPAHIHMTVDSPQHGRQWVESLLFADDPLVLEDDRARSKAAGRFAFVRPVCMELGGARVQFAVKLKRTGDF